MNSTDAAAEVPRAQSGRPVIELTVASAIGPDDVRISPDGMARQAAVAREHGDVQLAENLLRAAELLAAALAAIERAASDVNARPTTIEWKDLM